MKFIMICVLVLIFSGCSNTEKNKESQSENESTSSLHRTQKSKINESNTNSRSINEKSSKESTTTSSKNENTNETSNSIQAEKPSVAAPYAVSLQQVAKLSTFEQPYMSGSFAVYIKLATSNSPNGTLTFQSRSLKNPDKIETADVPFSINTIPTKEIRVFSNSKIGSGIRSVKVNTEIVCENQEKMYLFKNNQGSISLATENHVGNVTADQLDVMMENLQQN